MQIVDGKLPVANVENSSAGKEATARALEAFKNASNPTPQSQEHPVKNPSSVQPEEMSAITGTSSQTEEKKDTIETSTEESPEAVATKKPPEEPLSNQYAQLARKERAIRAKVQEVKAKEAELAAREAALTTSSTPKQPEVSLKDRAAKDPLGTLSELGLSYEQITDLLLNQDPQDQAHKAQMEELKAEIKALREESIKTRQEDQQSAYQNAVAQIRTDVTQLVKSDDAYETIRETGSVDDVVELIEETYKASKTLLTIEEAAQAVEEHLLEEALKLTKLKKIQSRMAAAKAASTPAPKQDPKQTQPAKTLTNAMTTGRQLTAKERAILAFEGKLNK